MRYLVDNGIKWRAMFCDFPPWPRAYAFFARRRCARPSAELRAEARSRQRRS
ncbi:hypothetical protein ACIP6X_16335 [Streptomyces coeruleorubidus]|uniref:hypothetical protein n=1 Tax=Streptomyces coeruleorubidus TaxID=116188 RepID=UPI0037FAF73C